MNMNGDVMTLADLGRDLWKARGFILIGIFLGLLASIFVFSTVLPCYRAELVVIPAQPMSNTDVTAVPGGDSLFATSYQTRYVGSDNSYEFLRFENTFAGPLVAQALLKEDFIKQGLMQERLFVFSRPDPVWTSEKLAEYIKHRVRVEPVGDTPLRKLVYYHPNPAFAAAFLNTIQKTTDILIRQNLNHEAEDRIRYLQKMLDTAENPEHKRVLTALLMEQERLRMLTSINQPYAAAPLEPPAVSYRPKWPDPALVLAGFIAAGALAGFAVHSLRRWV